MGASLWHDGAMLKQPRTAGVVAAALVGAVLALALASSASAHAALTASDPVDGASFDAAPAEVSATFSEILDGPSTEIAVTDPAGAVLDLDPAEFDGDTFVQPMRYTAPGEYTLAYRVISEDGHRVEGVIAFTVAEISDDLLMPGLEPETEDEDETTGEASPEPAPTATEAAAEDDENNPGAALAAILLGALALVIVGVVFVKLVGRRSKG
jgi:methionine-rich copper-binding protein CopC